MRAAVILAFVISRPVDSGSAVSAAEGFSAVEVALLASGVKRAIDVVAVDLLCRGVLEVEGRPGRLRRDVIVAGPNHAERGKN